MRKFGNIASLLAASAIVLQPCVLSAQQAATVPSPASSSPSAPPAVAIVPPVAGTPSSAFVRCDGSPNKASTLGTVARLVAITAIVGLLLPQREGYDPKKRQSGADGVKSCNEALNGAEPAKDGGRRIELIFGRAIHRMEMKDWDGALADIRSVGSEQPELTATAAYKQSLGLTAIELEAMALTGKGDFAGAHAAALRMASQGPYDIKTMLAAQKFLWLARSYTPEDAVYYDQLVRIYPLSLFERAAARASAGRFHDAATDFVAMAGILDSMPKGRGYSAQSRAAICFRLAGDAAEGDRLMKLAQERVDRDAAAGKSDSLVTSTTDGADLYAILVALDSGQAMRARTQFSARSRWNGISAGIVSEVARRLQKVGTPAEQANTPILTPAEIVAADQSRIAAVINDPGDDNADRFATFRPAFSPTEFNKFAANVWKTDKSRYIGQPAIENAPGELIDVSRNGSGVPGGYALMLHLALTAKARGARAFMLVPPQRYTYMSFFRTGTPGDGKIFTEAALDPDKVIADLSPVIPPPPVR